MLLTLGVENFGAFRDLQEFSLRRVKSAPQENASEWDPTVSTLAAIYGANASGKSTLIRALALLRGAVRDSYTKWEVDGETPVVPFLLDPSTQDRPTSLEVEVRADDRLDYQYGFSMDATAVQAEWLYVYRTARRSLLFRREGDALTFGQSFRGSRGLEEAALTRPNALTLSVAAQLGNQAVLPVFRTIVDSIKIHDAHSYRRGRSAVIDLMEKHPDLLDDMVRLVRNADLGIADISVVHLPEAAQMELRAELTKMGLDAAQIDAFLAANGRQLQLTHDCAQGPSPLPFNSESEGTKALLAFAPVIINALRDGSTVVIDEVDTSLHPAMVRALVTLFVSPTTNPHQAQLVVTTHDTTLLGNNGFDRVLERDQLWLTEKDPTTGAAQLTAVAEYSPRKGESLERGYLTGRYGGLPRLPAELFSLDVG